MSFRALGEFWVLLIWEVDANVAAIRHIRSATLHGMGWLRSVSPYVLAAGLTITGLTHFVSPAFYEGLIPAFLPAPRAWIYVSGGLELACAAAVAVPATRRRGALAAAALLVAVFPGNIYQAIEPGDVPRWAALARLPLQVPLVLWALSITRKFPSTAGKR